MIPFIRTTGELMVLTNSRSDSIKRKDDLNIKEENQSRSYLHSTTEEKVELPCIAKRDRLNWIKRKSAIKKFFDDLDYNNQNISSYELTLIKKQDQKDYYDAA